MSERQQNSSHGMYRDGLPQLGSKPFLTDGGLETTLVFLDGYDLPEFAAFDIMKDAAGIERLRDYYRQYIHIALEHRTGMVLETPTRRSSASWGAKIGYDAAALDAVNRQAVELLAGLREEYATTETPMVVSGCIGPQDDGYQAS